MSRPYVWRAPPRRVRAVKHVMYADKTHLVGDDVADGLVAYARALAITNGSDAVTIRAIDAHGNEVEATFLLNPSTIMMVESTNSSVIAPHNEALVEELRKATSSLLDAHPVQPEDHPPGSYGSGGEHFSH